MIDPVDEDDVRRELEGLGIFINDKRVISEFRKMCLLFNISAVKLAENWYEYKCKTPSVGDKPSDGHLDIFKSNYLTKEYLRDNDVKQENEPEMAMDTTADVVVCKTENSFDTYVQVKKEKEADDDDDEMKETIVEERDDLTAEEKNILFKKSVIAATDNSHSLLESDFSSTTVIDMKIKAIDDSRHVKQDGFRFCNFNLYEMCCCLEDQLKQAANFYRKQMGIPVVTDLSLDLFDDACYLCFVRKQPHKVKLNAESLLVEGTGDTYDDDSVLKHLSVDLSHLSGYSFFPGQIIAFRGMRIKDRMRITALLEAPTDTPIERTFTPTPEPLQFLVVSGPFVPGEQLTSLVKYVTEVKPHLMILIGPFVDARDSDAVVERNDDETFLKNLVSKLCSAGAHRVVIVPSVHDLHAVNVVPTPPLSLCHPNAVSFPNPCYFEVNGIRFAVLSVDILKHMMKQEFSAGLTDRMRRVVSQILSQRRLYPLFPVDREANVDYQLYKMLQLPCRPDFLILPSDLKSFVMDMEGCVCINSDRLTKGILSRIRVTLSPDSMQSDTQVFRL